MRCIFCKQDSSGSASVEHIVPESLGNTDHVLPIGVVCDVCNQYFARKVERQLLESPMFRLLRSDMAVPNKRGRIPIWLPSEGTKRPDYRQMGRFLAKIALEALAFKVQSVPGWNDELVDQPALDDLRRFARYNEGPDWPFTVRTLHPFNATFEDDNQRFELLHEFDILLTRASEAYLAIAIFGVEMVINLGGRENDGFRLWLQENDWASPLYAPLPDER
jgi:HNH endonuclease